MKIEATFQGKDGSLGYENDKRYVLDFHERSDRSIIISPCEDDPSEFAKRRACFYTSVHTFFVDWREVSKLFITPLQISYGTDE